MKKVKICDLVEDLEFYPRFQLSEQHARNLQEAIRAGAEMPPLVIEKSTKKIVDGWHRKRAYEKEYGPDHQVLVIEKTYKNPGEMILEAASLSAQHGLRLQPCDFARVIHKAKQYGVEDLSVIAKALSVTPVKLESIVSHRFARAEPGSVRAVPIKRTIQHMAGHDMTDGQVEANKKLSGMSQLFYVNQLITLLENDLIDKEDEKLLVGLKHLHELLEQLLVVS